MKKLTRRLPQLAQMMIMVSSILPYGQVYSDELDENNFNKLRVISEAVLEKLRAGDANASPEIQNIQVLQANVTGGDFNADNIVNGSITIGERAFDNFSGVGLVVGNTGNNNAIDAALGVTFHLQ